MTRAVQPSIEPAFGDFRNVHASGWCSSSYWSRESAAGGAERVMALDSDHPEGPIVARIRVRPHRELWPLLPAGYVHDAVLRGVFRRGEIYVMEHRNRVPRRYKGVVTARRLKVVLADARDTSRVSPDPSVRASAKRAASALQSCLDRHEANA